MDFTYKRAETTEEKAYIAKRKRKAFRQSLAFYLCRIFPIDKKLISVCTFEGKGGFGCNPKYLVQELHRRNPEYRFVWLVNKESWDKQFPDYIRKAPNTFWGRAYWLTRSRVWIDNYRKPYGTVKRKGQYYLNVNHYTEGIKCTGLYRGQGFSEMAYLVSKNDSDMVDDFVIDSKWCEDISPKALVYEGTYLNTGSPRCDILHGNRADAKAAFRKRHGISGDAKILLYAPTFREGANDGKRFVFSEQWSLDFARLMNDFEKKFGGNWYLCVRVHPQLAPTFAEYKNPALEGRLIDESQGDDMYEILAAMDAYITDYSCACFEAAFAEMPVFLYADDADKYSGDRGSLMWNLAADDRHAVHNNRDITPEFDLTMPFPLARTQDELTDDIADFDADRYETGLKDYFKSIGLVFNGDAAEKLAAVVEQHMK